VIAILAEMDSLPGLSNAAVPERKPVPGQISGHACGHNLFGSGAVAAAIGLLRGFDLVSPYPRLVAETWSERLIQPLLPWSWLTFLPLRAMERSRRPSLAAAGGQFLVLDRAAYDRAGGHEAVRDKVLEDIELARAVKRSGGRIALADGSRLARCRMYASWPELRDGYTKSLWASSGPAFFLVWYLLPLAALPWYPVPAGLAVLLGIAGRMIAARATGGRVLPDTLFHPASVLLFAYLVARSRLVVRSRRRRVTWKGRPVR